MSATLTTKTFGHSFYVDWKNRVKALILSRQWARKLGNTPITANCLDSALWNNGVLRLVIKGIGMRPKFLPASIVFASLEEIAEGRVDYELEDRVQAIEAEALEREVQATFEAEMLAEVNGQIEDVAFDFGFFIDCDNRDMSKGLLKAAQDYIKYVDTHRDERVDLGLWVGINRCEYLCYDPRDAKEHERVFGRPRIASAEALHPDNKVYDFQWPHEKLITYKEFFAKELKHFKKRHAGIYARGMAERCAKLYSYGHGLPSYSLGGIREKARDWGMENVEHFEAVMAEDRSLFIALQYPQAPKVKKTKKGKAKGFK